MPNFILDTTLDATVLVEAPDENTARQMLHDVIGSHANCANLGSWPNGDPCLAIVQIKPYARVTLLEQTDGEFVPEYLRDTPPPEYDAHVPHRIKLRGFGAGHSTPTASILHRAAFQEDDGEID